MATVTVATPDYVPVQLTSIVPVRVYDAHGEYFDTELSVDASMRVLQLAIEDYFKVKPEVQLLTHNRQQIDPQLSLKANGCLLLKGDPFVRITFLLKRGPLLNLVCQMCSTREVFPLACAEDMTVWEVKKRLCEEVARKREEQRRGEGGGPQQQRPLAPQQVRLLWRYMEINDRATLLYYRLPTNSVLTVMLKRGGGSRPVATAVSAQLPRRGSRALSPTTAWERPAAVGATAPQPSQQQRPFPAAVDPIQYSGDASRAMSGMTGRAPQAIPGQEPYVTATATAPMPPFSDTPAAAPVTRSHPIHGQVVPVGELQMTMRSLEHQLEQLRGEVRTRRSGELYDAEWSRRSQGRIAELEAAVERFHGYLQRALVLIAT